jgi:NTE family protein
MQMQNRFYQNNLKTTPMSQKEFIEQPEFQELLEKARGLKTRIYSDVIDDEGYQYVDLVQEGGGVLGIALLGYTYILEEAGIRFFGLAGTSAGAINTMALAGIGKINVRKSGEILEAFSNMNMFDFVDGDARIKKITQEAIDGKPMKKLKWKILRNFSRIRKAIFDDLGMNPGKRFEKWIGDVLENSEGKVKTIGDLEDLRDKKNFPAGLKYRKGGAVRDEKAEVFVITSDITTQTKVRFPKMAPLYWGDDYKDVKAALLVRASMSVPIFFLPFEVSNIPNAGKKADKNWEEWAEYKGKIPGSVKFVDGGMISNFPINVFHAKRGQIPSRPTFGVRLSSYRDEYNDVEGLGGFIGAMVGTMRHDGDVDFLVSNPDYDRLICFIDADKKFKWLNFNMSADRQKELFLLGARRGLSFLEKFDWEEYKNIRKELNKPKIPEVKK